MPKFYELWKNEIPLQILNNSQENDISRTLDGAPTFSTSSKFEDVCLDTVGKKLSVQKAKLSHIATSPQKHSNYCRLICVFGSAT